jgi:spore coat polysaccharide biosynthesis protein SpsF
MEAGPFVEIKNLAIIQARMTSSRLPGKVLLPLPFPNGTPLIYRIIEKLRHSKQIDKIIVVVPSGPMQSPLTRFLETEKIPFLEGDEMNVLSRFTKAIRRFNPKSVIRITADNPFIDVGMLDDFISRFELDDEDYWRSSHLPYGMNMEIFSANALLYAENLNDLSDDNKEHVTTKFLDNNFFKHKSIKMYPVNLSHLRVTVDDNQDYMRAALLYQLQRENSMDNDLDFILDAMKNYPYLFS